MITNLGTPILRFEGHKVKQVKKKLARQDATLAHAVEKGQYVTIPPVENYGQPAGVTEITRFVDKLLAAVRRGDRPHHWRQKFAELLQGSPYLKLFKTRPQGFEEDWMFAQPFGKGAVHALTLSTQKKLGRHKDYVNLLVTKRPSMGGDDPNAVKTIENPAGVWGDKGPESPIEALIREGAAETGMQVVKAKLLAGQMFATSPGVIREGKFYGVIQVVGEPNANHREEEVENRIIVDQIRVPLKKFISHKKFSQWLAKMNKQGFMVAQDVLVARALMPPDIKKWLHSKPQELAVLSEAKTTS